VICCEPYASDNIVIQHLESTEKGHLPTIYVFMAFLQSSNIKLGIMGDFILDSII